MPIFMDLHQVPGINATGAAEAHREDLAIQHLYGCTCMTYWVDESKDCAFCLIEAPNEQAVHDLHNNAHGLTPHKIIEVNTAMVEAFLGRIYDPETPEISQGQLKVFNDPAFRIIVCVTRPDPAMLALVNNESIALETYKEILNSLPDICHDLEGELAEYFQDTDVISFKSASRAIEFAMKYKALLSSYDIPENIYRISIHGGLPVGESKRIFGDVIEKCLCMQYTSQSDKIKVSGLIKELLSPALILNFQEKIRFYREDELEILGRIKNIIENNISAENFNSTSLLTLMNTSKSSLNRTTLSLTGFSPNELIIQYRIIKARQLLRNSHADVSQIAYSVGYKNPSYFSKMFRKHTGMRPSAYAQSFVH